MRQEPPAGARHEAVQAKRRPAWRRWARRTAFAAGAFALLLAGFLLWIWCACVADPPELAVRPAILDERPVGSASGLVRIGRSWFRQDRGLSVLYLEGSPFEIGYANATLTADLLELQERSLIETAESLLGSRWALLAVGLVVLVNNRNLPDFVEEEYQVEILGLASGGRDPFPHYGPRYHRILNYHAAHDISHWVLDRPVVGCTAFAARDARTRDGRLLVGRNFDFESGRHFDENKVVGLYRPERGHAFLSVSWPGMAGAVTGMNAAGLFCSINGARSEDDSNIGTPVSLVVREVLQYASTVSEAIETIRAARVFVTDSFLLAQDSRAEGGDSRAVVVEKTPARAAVREMEGDLLLQANHFESPLFSTDAGNQEALREGTTRARRDRLEEVLAERTAPLDPEGVVAVLRDRLAAGGRPLPAGHRAAINPMIATHSVVADLSRRILWVSRAPHQLGRFEAFSIESFPEPPAAPLCEDPALEDGLYESLTEARRLIAETEARARNARSLGREDRRRLERALALNPGDPGALDLLGRVLEDAGDLEGARRAWRQALEVPPPFLEMRRQIEANLDRVE